MTESRAAFKRLSSFISPRISITAWLSTFDGRNNASTIDSLAKTMLPVSDAWRARCVDLAGCELVAKHPGRLFGVFPVCCEQCDGHGLLGLEEQYNP